VSGDWQWQRPSAASAMVVVRKWFMIGKE